MREIASRRAALDADEARWLREAEALQIWRPLGMVSALDYLERVLGYAPRTAHDRLRVARALGSLPQLTAALSSGRLPHSAIRELTRIAKPATEAAWIAAVIGKNLREIEELVAKHREGDKPDDPPNPQAHTHVVRFELAAETFALLRQARTVLRNWTSDRHRRPRRGNHGDLDRRPDHSARRGRCGSSGGKPWRPRGRAQQARCCDPARR